MLTIFLDLIIVHLFLQNALLYYPFSRTNSVDCTALCWRAIILPLRHSLSTTFYYFHPVILFTSLSFAKSKKFQAPQVSIDVCEVGWFESPHHPIFPAVLQGIQKAVQAGEETSSEEHVNINEKMRFEGRGTYSRERIGERRSAQGVY